MNPDDADKCRDDGGYYPSGSGDDSHYAPPTPGRLRAWWRELCRSWRAFSPKEKTETVFEFLILVAAILAAVFTYGQMVAANFGNTLTRGALKAAVEANKLTREQFAASVRPRLIVKEFAVMRGHSEGDPVVFVVTVANVGEGPAVNVHVTRKSRTYMRPMPAGMSQNMPPGPLDEWPPGKNGSFRRSILPERGPTSSLAITIDSPHLNDARQRGNLGANGPWRFVVSGKITYQSEVEPDRTFPLCYCMVWRPKWGQMTPAHFGETTPADQTLPVKPERAAYDECTTDDDGCTQDEHVR